MPETSLLVITGMRVPPYSVRGLSQTLEPIAAAVNVKRTANGNLRDVSATQFRKFSSTITCTDQQAPALNGIWPGMVVTVDCVSELCYFTAGDTDEATPERTVVSGSSRVDGDFTFYRPQLTMMITGLRVITDEYDAAIGWTMDLEEV